MTYELIVIWETGEKNVYEYNSEQDAQQGEANMKMAFGNQIQWTGINRR